MAKITKLTSLELIDVLTSVVSEEILEILNDKACRLTIVRLDSSVAFDVQKLNFKKNGLNVKEGVTAAICFSMNDNSITAEQYKGESDNILLPNSQEIYLTILNEVVGISEISGNGVSDDMILDREETDMQRGEEEYDFSFEEDEDNSNDSDSEENSF